MSDKEKPLQETAWEKVLEKALSQLTDPWDWFAVGLGAASGAGIALIKHLPELGTIMAIGIVTGVSIRKAWVAVRFRPNLRRRARALEELLRKIQSLADSTSQVPPADRDPQKLLSRLQYELRLWETKATSNEEFAQQLNDLIDEFRLAIDFITTPRPRGNTAHIRDPIIPFPESVEIRQRRYLPDSDDTEI